jgi:hypothetical protein
MQNIKKVFGVECEALEILSNRLMERLNTMRNFTICPLPLILLLNYTKKDEVGEHVARTWKIRVLTWRLKGAGRTMRGDLPHV